MQTHELDQMNTAALDLFGAVAQAVYETDPVWAPASEAVFLRDWKEHQEHPEPVFRPVVVTDDGRPLARAVAILSPRAATDAGTPAGYIGFFDCVEDRPDAARCVLARCEQILTRAGARTVQAPKADNFMAGCQTARFDLPQLCLTPHNPPYYRALFEAAGFTVAQHIHAFTFSRDTFTPLALGEAGFFVPGITTRLFDRTILDVEIENFHRLQAAVFSDRTGYVPRTLAQDRAMIEALLPIIDDDLIVFAEDAGGETVGLLVCLPDFYQALAGQLVDRVRIVSIGILPSHARQGIGTAMGLHLMKNLLPKQQFVFAEVSLVLADNVPPQALADRFHALPGREFVLFEKDLQ